MAGTDTLTKPEKPAADLSKEKIDQQIAGLEEQFTNPSHDTLPQSEVDEQIEGLESQFEQPQGATIGSLTQNEVEKRLANKFGMGSVVKNRDLDARLQGTATYDLFRAGISSDAEGQTEALDALKKVLFNRGIAFLEKRFKGGGGSSSPKVDLRLVKKPKTLLSPPKLSPEEVTFDALGIKLRKPQIISRSVKNDLIPGYTDFTIEPDEDFDDTEDDDSDDINEYDEDSDEDEYDSDDQDDGYDEEDNDDEPEQGSDDHAPRMKGKTEGSTGSASAGGGQESQGGDAAPSSPGQSGGGSGKKPRSGKRNGLGKKGANKAKGAAGKGLKNLSKKALASNPYGRAALAALKARETLKKARENLTNFSKLAKKSIVTFFKTPYGRGLLIGIGVILLLFLAGDSELEPNETGTENITANINCPEKVNTLDENITCTISASHPTKQIIVKFTYSSNATLVSATEGYTEQVRSVIWEGKTSFTGEVVIHPTILDSQVETELDVQVVESAGGEYTGSAEYVPPNSDICSGKYLIFDTSIDNFGNPNCDFTKADLYNLLASLEPPTGPSQPNLPGKDFWFFYMAPCESGYEPNAFNGTGETPDAAGAWGLWQMGSSNPPGQAPPAPGKNGPYDRGDVKWPVQTTNAISYAKNLVTNGNTIEGYWAAARESVYSNCFVDPTNGVQ